MHVLPNNPDFLKLTNSQIYWLTSNMEIDMQLQNEALKKSTGKDEFEFEVGNMSQEELLEQVKARRGGKR